MSKGNDVEAAGSWGAFSDRNVRNGFIRKVYGILAAQFALTTVIIGIMQIDAIKNYVLHGGWWITFVGFLGFLVIFFLLVCCVNLRRTVPTNFFLLIGLTFFMSIMVGCICMNYEFDTILYAALICFIICLTVSLFSCWTSFDFTKLIWIMFIVTLVFVLAGIILIFIPNKTAHIIYSAIGVAVFTVYLAIDTQMIMGGKRVQLSTEEYILGAVHLYIDIIYIFLYLLQLLRLLH